MGIWLEDPFFLHLLFHRNGERARASRERVTALAFGLSGHRQVIVLVSIKAVVQVSGISE